MPRMTNAQLVDENIRLRANAEHLERKLQAWHDQYQGLKAENETLQAKNEVLSAQLSDARENRRAPGRVTRPDPREFSLYWEYVKAEKAAQRGNAVCSYLSREQFDQARSTATN